MLNFKLGIVLCVTFSGLSLILTLTYMYVFVNMILTNTVIMCYLHVYMHTGVYFNIIINLVFSMPRAYHQIQSNI